MITAPKEPESYIVYHDGRIGLGHVLGPHWREGVWPLPRSGPVRLETLADAFEMQLGLHYEADSYTFTIRAMHSANFGGASCNMS